MSGDPLNVSAGDEDDLDALLAQADSMISEAGSGGPNIVIDGFGIDSDEDDDPLAEARNRTGSSGEDDVLDVSLDSPSPQKMAVNAGNNGNAPKVPIPPAGDPLLHPLHEDVVHANSTPNMAARFPVVSNTVHYAMGAMRNLAVAAPGMVHPMATTTSGTTQGIPTTPEASLESQFKAQTSRFAANLSSMAQRVAHAAALPNPQQNIAGFDAANYPQPMTVPTPNMMQQQQQQQAMYQRNMSSSTGSLNNSQNSSGGSNSPYSSQSNSAHGMSTNSGGTIPTTPTSQPQQQPMMLTMELDAEQKTALVELHLHGGKLLPGEKVIMFLHNLLHVSDSTGFQYVANTAGSSGLGGTTVWCCAMTYYRLIVFGTTQELIVHVMNTVHTSSTTPPADATTTPTSPASEGLVQLPPPFLKHPFGAPPDWNASCWPPAFPTVLEMPLSTMEKVEKSVYTASTTPTLTGGAGAGSGAGGGPMMTPASPSAGAVTTLMGLQIWAKHGRIWRLTTTSYADTLRAHQALLTYAFPGRRNLGYLFAFESKRADVVNSVVTDPNTGQKTVSLALVRKRFDAVAEFQRQFHRYQRTTTNNGTVVVDGTTTGTTTTTTTPSVQPWKIWTGLNGQYQLCMSYPSVLVGPASLDEHNPDAVRLLQSCAAFRSEQRLPALAWASGMDGASIWRCSQPKIGLQGNRSPADELVLKHIMEAAKSANALREQPLPVRMNTATMAAFTGTNDLANSHWVKEAHGCFLKILDLRPRSAAMANRTGGYGYENTSNYPGTTLQFCNITNIHGVRDAYQKMTALCLNQTSSNNDVTWGSALEDTKWLSHIRILLAASWETAFWVHVHRMPVLLHCSHGWDRTSQVSALAQLLLDPYYRTMEGFACLMEKDFMSFGHPFHTRCAHGEGKGGSGGGGVHHQDGVGGAGGIVGSSSDVNNGVDEGQISPIFLQFLDCVWQIVQQFPECFEFTTDYLLELSDHIYSCRFGNMLCDTERERELVAGIRQRTYSLWDHLEQNPEDPNADPNAKLWRNKHYDASPNAGGGVLLMPMPTLLRNVTLWKDRHARFGPKATLRWRNTDHAELWQPRPTEAPAAP